MNASYRPGTLIVAATVAASLVVCGAYQFSRPQTPVRAGEDLGENAFPLGAFRLTERSGKTVTEADFDGRVWISSFIFTRCPLSCPKISSILKSLQGNLDGGDIRLVSISVDPEHDTPEILSAYARRFEADPDRWWFLTGPKPEVYDLIRNRFKLGVEPADEDAQKAGAEAFSHSDRLALVKGNQVVGFFDSSDPAKVEALLAKARQLSGTAPAWAKALPAVNAGLNATCTVLLLLGWTFVRRGNLRAHAASMIACVVVSGLFLTCYLVYHYHVGSVAFRGQGPIRVVYFTILLSHTLLATFALVPLVLLTLTHAIRRRFDRHARIARVTFPIWLYVSVTGVVIYLMLYQLPVGQASPAL